MLYELVKKHYTEETVENLATLLFYSAELNNTLDQNNVKLLAFNKEGNCSVKMQRYHQTLFMLYVMLSFAPVKRGRNLEC